eukprot:GEMP01032769.1.p1 GENE.GEMP01032769.1~~GEMP01032769.1.p1  ORF type:complete len:364 (+),score=76.57 GEMP01032769.1:187-1278(+)
MTDVSKSEKANVEVENNAQNDDFSSSDETSAGDSNTKENKRLSNDEDDSAKEESRHCPIARLDPFRCNKAKLAVLLEQVEKMSSLEKKKFLMQPIPPDLWFQCCVLRISTGVTKFNRMFRLFIDRGDIVERRDILASCVKRKGNRTSNYCIMTDLQETNKDSEYCVGKIRSNFIGSRFTAFDGGQNPKKLTKHKENFGEKLAERVRGEMASIIYDNPLINKKKAGPRQMTVVIPHVENSPDGSIIRTECKALSPSIDGLEALTTHHAQNTVADGMSPLVRTYVSKPAKWSKQMNSYVLDFNDRVTRASVKNFQLVQKDDASEIYLQFGRFEKQNFHLDFRYPMSPFQALSLAVSSMDYKMCTE